MSWNCFEQMLGHWRPVSAFPFWSVVHPTFTIVIDHTELYFGLFSGLL